MIRRRVVEHVKAQNWTAVFLDFVIVVAGVFVGIQVSNWNAARLESRESARFNERLRADLREEAWAYDYLLEYFGDVLVNAERTLAALEGKSALSDEEMLIAAYRATQYQELLRRRETYDEMISTGSIGLIRDQDLRDTAMRVYTTPMFRNIAQDGIASRYRQAFRMLIPTEVQGALGKNCGDRFVEPGDYRGIVDSIDYQCATGLSKEAIGEAAALLRSDATLAPLLRLRIADIKSRLTDLVSNNPDIVDGLRAAAKDTP
jgi:hypothetical protein